jgi:hypothetical protein
MRRALVVPALVAILCAVDLPAAQQRERFTLAVMRRDGVMLPFASYDGDWSLPWPTSLRNIELPITVDAVPKKWWGREMPTQWTFWPTTGSPAAKVVAAAPIAILIGTEKRLGVRTDFVSGEALAPPSVIPYPKEGLVTSGDVKIETIAGVSRQTTAWRDLPRTLLEDIDLAEQVAVEKVRANTRWVHPLSRATRRGIPAQLEAWYTSTLEQPGFGLSYIEAVKKYPPGEEDDGCGLETFISGWVHGNSRQPKPKTDLTARITYCDRDGVSYMLPLGRVRVNSRTHWVFQMSGWDNEWYTVVEATPGRVRFVAEYFAGGRRRLF